MSDKEKELEKYKQLLLERREQILSGIKHITDDNLKKTLRESSGDISGYTYHMADMASDAYAREILLNLASSEREIVLAIDEALKRIEEKTFGFCLLCQKPIAKQRLDAISYAKNCIECQKKQEEQERPPR